MDGQFLQLGGRLVNGGLHFEEAGRPGGPAVREVRREQVALGGHGGESGPRVDQVLGLFEGSDDDDPAQQPSYGGHQFGRSPDELGGVRRPVAPLPVLLVLVLVLVLVPAPAPVPVPVVKGYVRGGAARPSGVGAGVLGCSGEQQCRAARVLLAQQTDGLGRRGGCGDRDGVRGRAERGGQRNLEAGGDRQQSGGGTEDTGEPVGGAEQRSRAVLAPQAEGQRLAAGLGGGPLAFGRGGRLAGRAQRGLRVGQGAPGRLVLSREVGVARVEAVDLGLQLLVLLLSGDRAFLGLVAGGGEPVDLGLRGGGA